MYDALNKGFARATGEIFGWINAGDFIQKGGLLVAATVFEKFPEVEWLTGRPTGVSSGGMTTNVGRIPRWARYRFLAGANEHIQQESTFWRKSLWDRAGGQLDASYRDVGDFELWIRFFRSARLYSVHAIIGGYRFHPDAISYVGRAAYYRRCDEIIDRELSSVPFGNGLRIFRKVSKTMMKIPVVRRAWRATVIRALYRMPGSDLTPIIENTDQGWTLMQ
jgi:hypothetical protein